DAQLRTMATTTTTTAEVGRPAAGYVFVAPAEAKPALAAARATTASTATEEPVARAVNVPPVLTALATAARSVEPAAAWSARLPDPRLPETMPTVAAERATAFVARLVGVEAARDAAVLPAASTASLVVPVAAPTSGSRVDSPVSALVRAAPAATYVALP